MNTENTDGRLFEESWELKKDSDRGLPEGRFSFVAVRRNGKTKMQAALISVPDRGDRTDSSKVLDDGLVIVDYNSNGEIMSIELLTRKGRVELPEFSALLEETKDPVLRVGYVTARVNWTILEALCRYDQEPSFQNVRAFIKQFYELIVEPVRHVSAWKDRAQPDAELVLSGSG